MAPPLRSTFVITQTWVSSPSPGEERTATASPTESPRGHAEAHPPTAQTAGIAWEARPCRSARGAAGDRGAGRAAQGRALGTPSGTLGRRALARSLQRGGSSGRPSALATSVFPARGSSSVCLSLAPIGACGGTCVCRARRDATWTPMQCGATRRAMLTTPTVMAPPVSTTIRQIRMQTPARWQNRGTLKPGDIWRRGPCNLSFGPSSSDNWASRCASSACCRAGRPPCGHNRLLLAAILRSVSIISICTISNQGV